MSLPVVLTDAAQDDLDRITDYIANVLLNKTAARRFLDNIDKVVEIIGFMPQMNPLCQSPLLHQRGIRVHHFHGYGMYYHISSDAVTVYRISSDKTDNSSDEFVISLLDINDADEH